MILSHRHKFIFIKTEKTAGTSVEIALSSICGPDDIITGISPKDEAYRRELGFPGKQNHHLPFSRYRSIDWLKLLTGERRRYFNHMSARDVIDRIGRDIWEDYFTFTIERNPFDKFISYYYWRGGDNRFGDFWTFIESGIADELRGFELYSLNGQVIVDTIYHFEELDHMMDDLTDRLDLDRPLTLPAKKTKSGIRKDTRHFSDVLPESVIEWIAERHAIELELFDYATP